jgi:predicted secreted protein
MTSMIEKGEPRRHLKDCVVAAIETGASFRGPEAGSGQTGPVERLIAIIESEAARLRGNDFSALNSVLAGQALALDTMFAQLARESVEDNVLDHQVMRLALRAQSQSRATPRQPGFRCPAAGPSQALAKKFRRTNCCKPE